MRGAVCRCYSWSCRQGRTQHSSKVANEPPARNQPAFFFSFFFFLFAFSHWGLGSHKWIESKWVWQTFFCETRTQKIAIVKLEENCGGGRGRGPGHPSRSRSPEARCERGAQGIAVHIVEAMWRSGAVSRLKPDYRKEKNFKDRAVFECLGGRL